MGKQSKKQVNSGVGLADPTRLKPFTKKAEENSTGIAKKGEELLQVIIETPKGCRNKYSFDPEQKIYVLKSSLPAGMCFPYDFGFVPRTIAGDGDPLDVLVLMDEPAFPGCALMARIIGVIEGEQTSSKGTNRNDRLVAVAETARTYEHMKSLKDLPKQAFREIEEFFVNYHRLQGKTYKLLGCGDQHAAEKLIKSTGKNASKAADKKA
jgi:inorganic pyrophosphatase